MFQKKSSTCPSTIKIKGEKVICFKEVVDRIKQMNPAQRLLIPNVVKMCQLLLVNPATTATAERSFSLARRVKTWMRSTMLPSRFNSLATLHAHKQLTDSLDLRDVANDFVSKTHSRKAIFSRF